MPIQIPIKFLVDPVSGRSAQTEFFNLTKRHQGFSGGYGNGKSFAASLKALILLTTFPKYRVAICRRSVTDLKRSTMSTFFKVCPPELYEEKNGGKRADSLNYLKLINGSEVFWMHLDDADESTVRGLEVNSVVIDQAEEISENMYNHLSARVGRWDMAEVPREIYETDPKSYWNPETERYNRVPNYMMILCNPDHELHWIYRRYHSDSIEHQECFRNDYDLIEASSTENPTLDSSTLKDMMSNDPIWVRRFVYGKWGIPGGTIHNVLDESILSLGKGPGELSWDFLENIKLSGNNYRVLDHGDAAPTCCIWFTAFKDWFFAWQEYYAPGKLVSQHRQSIYDLSLLPNGTPLKFKGNWSDPSIFKKDQQKHGGFWSVADEYADPWIETGRIQPVPIPGIVWSPADNNEFATRNRINEYLKPIEGIRHPITGQDPAPRIYFIKKTETYSQGCYNLILQTKSQKRILLDTVNGRPIYGDDRDETIPDHAYDNLRYFCAMHPFWSKVSKINSPKGSFFDVRRSYLALKKAGKLNYYGESPLGVY